MSEIYLKVLEYTHRPLRRILQLRVKNRRKGRGLYEEGMIEERRAALFDNIETWRSIQPLYMPGITQLRQLNATRTDALPDSEDAKRPEAIQLWLPSHIPQSLWQTGCVTGLLQKEKTLRVAEATDALNGLRRQLRIMTGVFNYKKTHVSGTGQRSNTRARTLMAQVSDKTRLFAERYRAARRSLVVLDPNGEWQDTLKPLQAKDVRGMGRYNEDEDSAEGRRELSWIWLSSKQVTEGEDFEAAEGKHCFGVLLVFAYRLVVIRDALRVGEVSCTLPAVERGGSPSR